MYKTHSGPSQKTDASSRDFSHTFPLNDPERNMSEEEKEQERLMMEIQYMMSDEIFDDVVITPTPSDKFSLTERFGRLEVFKKPVLFIYSDSDNNLKISEDVMAQISSIDVTLNVVAVCGLYRTGKSYLMNRLAKERKGFSLGSTVRSETKGIWAWCKPHPTQTEQVLLLLDTEGLGDVVKGDTEHDNKMFSLTMLLSSTLIYNNTGVFNQDAVEKLAFITRVSRNVQVLPRLDRKENEDTMKIITPIFILCLRDFYLEVKDEDGTEMSPDKYFEKCLSRSDGKGNEKIDETRECIKKYFPRRKCFTLAQPAMGRKLAKVDDYEDYQLNDEFVSDCNSLQEYVYACEHKVTDGVTKAPIKGYDFESFTRTYVGAMRTGSMLSYEKAFDQVSKFHNSKLVVTSVHEFETELKEMKMPVKRKTDIEGKTFEILNKKLKQLREKMYPYKVNIFEDEAMKKMKTIADEFREQNSALVLHTLLEALEKLHDDIIKQNEIWFDSKEGLKLYSQNIDCMKVMFNSEMQDYDEDERLIAIINFEKSIDDEKVRIAFNAQLHEEKERKELLEKELNKSVKLMFDQRFEKLEAERNAHMEKKMREFERNFTERAGEEAVKKKSFLERFKLLFI
ncbi:guanylate-binding protein 1-like [Ruditapes philippinarum]|uniref:guanylate-binding protein 1-like n=1 Tax=Ruditapes philippinarum TaxID=129788 RepID=UPI00295B8C66|nr:guanylate-binding protein 1-like [Ruditapes philippinarum]